MPLGVRQENTPSTFGRLFTHTSTLQGWTNGASLQATVDTGTRQYRTNRNLLGVATWQLSLAHNINGSAPIFPFDNTGPGGAMQYTVPESVERDLRRLRVPCSRVGAIAAETESQRFGNLAAVLDAVALWAGRLGIPLDSFILTLNRGLSDSATPNYNDPTAAANAAIQAYDRGFRWLIMENEPYNRQWRTTEPMSRFTYDAAGQSAYVTYTRQVYNAVKAARPQAMLGICHYRQGTWWNLQMLTQSESEGGALGAYDWVDIHPYYMGTSGFDLEPSNYNSNVVRATGQDNAMERLVLANVVLQARWVQGIREAIGASVPLLATEWGMSAYGVRNDTYVARNVASAPYIPRNSTMHGLLIVTNCLLMYHNMGFYGLGPDALCLWHLLASPWPDIDLDPNRPYTGLWWLADGLYPYRRSTYFYLYQLLLRHWGDYYLPVSGTGPIVTYPDQTNTNRTCLATQVQATMAASGRRMFIILTNGRWATDYPFQLSWTASQFSASGYRAWLVQVPDGFSTSDGTPNTAGKGIGFMGFFEGNTGNRVTDTAVRFPTAGAPVPMIQPHTCTVNAGSISGTLPARSILFITVDGTPGAGLGWQVS